MHTFSSSLQGVVMQMSTTYSQYMSSISAYFQLLN
jgi:hypothetical protein